jgi:CRP/FNR family cyclic AMP-dependent transcriptional regulator
MPLHGAAADPEEASIARLRWYKSRVSAPLPDSFDASAFFATLKAGKATRDYRSKAVVFAQGERANAVFYVQTGAIKLTVVSPAGKAAVIAILRDGSFFGEGCLAGQPLRVSTATALDDSTLVRIDRKTVVTLLHREASFAAFFTAYILSRNLRIEEDLLDQLFNSSEKRLARTLLMLAHFGQESNPEPAIVKISQTTLASMVGTTRSRVSFFMSHFRKMGFLYYDGDGLKVHSSLLTVVLRD